MTAMKLIAHAVCLSAALGVCGLAVAGSPCSGYEVVNANGDHVILADNPTLPNHLAVGTCLGDYEKGTCTYRDRDGDERTIAYEKPAESAQGTAKQIRGTGKYAKTQASFQYRDAGWVETLQVFAWSGECE
jgi:hypothetical protein